MAARARAKTTGPSRMGRVAKFFITIYLLVALVYTAFHFVLSPALHLLVGTEVAPAPPAALPKVDPPVLVNPPALARLRTAAEVKAKKEHPALETAGVKAADIRDEDSEDRVWAAAEAQARKGAKKQPKGYVRPTVLTNGRELVAQRIHGLAGVEWGLDQMSWHHPSSLLAHSGPVSPHAVYNEHPEPVSIPEDHFLSLSFSAALQPSKVIPYYYRASAPDEPGFVKEDITITTLVTSNRFKVFQRLVERYRGKSPDPLSHC